MKVYVALISSFSYDDFGNTTSYDGLNLTYIRGSILSSISDGTNTYNYHYNSDGIRYKKIINNAETIYGLDGNKIIYEKGVNNFLYLYEGNEIIGLYDLDTHEKFFYVKDVTGNIISIIQNDVEVNRYKYDAYGNCEVYTYNYNGELVIDNTNYSIGNRNPFRYKSYYYDKESGLYYLNSRYYNPKIGRFITIDNINYIDENSIYGYNLYCYCGNNPVMYSDPNGNSAEWLANVGRFIGGLCIGAIGLAALGITVIGGGPLCLIQPFSALVQMELSAIMYGGFMMASSWDEGIKKDMDTINWNPFNNNISAATSSDKVSFYKGCPIIRTNGDSLSFGMIFLASEGFTDDGIEWTTDKILLHEYGHYIQLTTYGFGLYFLCIGIPSFIYNDQNSPWEISADLLGGVQRPYNSVDVIAGELYYLLTSLLGLSYHGEFRKWQKKRSKK